MRSTEFLTGVATATNQTDVIVTDDSAAALGLKGIRVAGQYQADESADPVDGGDAGTVAVNDRRGLRVDLQTLISGEDQTRDLLTISDSVHRNIHNGVHFTYADYDGYVTPVLPKYWRITTPNSSTRINLSFSCDASESGGVVELFENPTLNAAGTAGVAYNSDRNSATAATATVFYDTTTTSDGTRIWAGIIPVGGGTISYNESTPANRKEVILKQNEDYIIKFSAYADFTAAALVLSWYEI